MFFFPLSASSFSPCSIISALIAITVFLKTLLATGAYGLCKNYLVFFLTITQEVIISLYDYLFHCVIMVCARKNNLCGRRIIIMLYHI